MPANLVIRALAAALWMGVAAGQSITGLVATPGSLSFQANNPTGVIAASGPATITFTIAGTETPQNWTLKIAATSPSFSGCATVPISAVTATCSSVTRSGSGSGTCQSSFGLTTTPVTLASGTQQGSSTLYTVTVAFTFTDSWRYVAAWSPTCSQTLIYTVDTF